MDYNIGGGGQCILEFNDTHSNISSIPNIASIVCIQKSQGGSSTSSISSTSSTMASNGCRCDQGCDQGYHHDDHENTLPIHSHTHTSVHSQSSHPVTQQQQTMKAPARYDYEEEEDDNELLALLRTEAGDLYIKEPLGQRWDLGARIGQGGMGAVYIANCVYDRNTVAAVKVIDKQVVVSDIKKMRMVQSEISCLRTIWQQGFHPNIVCVYEVCEDRKSIYIVQEYLDGGELFSLLAHSHCVLPERDCVVLMRSLVSAISYLHSLEICHRDIKPENVMFAKGLGVNGVKLIDFGVSFLEKQAKVMNRMTVGSPLYLPPEAVCGEPYTYAADIWSLGVVAYIVLTGSLPYNLNDSDNLLDLVLEIGPNFDIPEFVSLSNHAQDFVMLCLRNEKQRRPTAAQLLEHSWLQQFKKDNVVSQQFATRVRSQIEPILALHKSHSPKIAFQNSPIAKTYNDRRSGLGKTVSIDESVQRNSHTSPVVVPGRSMDRHSTGVKNLTSSDGFSAGARPPARATAGTNSSTTALQLSLPPALSTIGEGEGDMEHPAATTTSVSYTNLSGLPLVYIQSPAPRPPPAESHTSPMMSALSYNNKRRDDGEGFMSLHARNVEASISVGSSMSSTSSTHGPPIGVDNDSLHNLTDKNIPVKEREAQLVNLEKRFRMWGLGTMLWSSQALERSLFHIPSLISSSPDALREPIQFPDA